MRTAALLLGLALAAGACGSKDKPKETAVSQEATTTTTTLLDVTSTTAAAAGATTSTTARPRTTTTAAAVTPTTAAATTTTTKPPTTTTAPPPPAGAAITIQNFSFMPAVLNVSVGTRVTATNQDGTTHTWTSDSNLWTSGNLSQGQSFSFTFSAPGTYAYHCAIHSSMKGTVNVS